MRRKRHIYKIDLVGSGRWRRIFAHPLVLRQCEHGGNGGALRGNLRAFVEVGEIRRSQSHRGNIMPHARTMGLLAVYGREVYTSVVENEVNDIRHGTKQSESIPLFHVPSITMDQIGAGASDI